MARKSFMSAEDQKREKELQEGWQIDMANGDTEAANQKHFEVESMRNSYGYSGGADGSQYNPILYQSEYDDQINAAMDSLTNQKAFSYDYTTDPLYQQYEKTYRREGDRARQNTMADYSTMTGGLPSSWAVSAAQQAQGYYNQQLADKIPELQQLAYQMYQDQITNERNNLNSLLALDSNAQNRWANNVNQINYADETEYNRNIYADETAYNRGRDAINDARYEDETAYSRKLDTWNQIMQQWQVSGKLSEEGAKILGIPAGTPTSSHYFSQLQQDLNQLQADRQNSLSWASLNNSRAAQANSASNQEKNFAMDMWKASGSNGASEAVAKILGIKPGQVYGGKNIGQLDNSHYGEIYSEMMQSGDPEQWLAQNASGLSKETLDWLYDMLY